MQFVDENTFRISVSSFGDIYNFDMKSVQKECVHIVTPDLKRIPSLSITCSGGVIMMNTTFKSLVNVAGIFNFKDLFTFEDDPPPVRASVMAVFIAILLISSSFDKRLISNGKAVHCGHRTMIAFFVVYYLVILFRLGQLTVDNGLCGGGWQSGALMVAVGAGVNILGRFQLKSNWSNHIKIYEDQFSRNHRLWHRPPPLYALLMLMLLGGS